MKELSCIMGVSSRLDTGSGVPSHQSVRPSPTLSPSCGTLEQVQYILMGSQEG